MIQTLQNQLLPAAKLPLVMPVQPFQCTELQTAHLEGWCKSQCKIQTQRIRILSRMNYPAFDSK